MVNKKFKELICELYGYNCELCNKHFTISELECHRLRRGYKCGKYEPRNVKLLCNNCHKLIHGNEFK
jgi:hypothetical protein